MIYVLSGEDAKYYPELMREVYRLRHEIFVKEMGWHELARADGLEIDQFDYPEAVHHICVRGNKVVGYQRLLPSTMPNLLSEVFPYLCEGPQPKGQNIYELTRYCVAPAHREGRRGLSSVGSELMAGCVEWGLAEGVDKVVIEFETVWVLRLLQLKFMARPLGYETQIGRQKIVATELTFGEGTLKSIQAYRGSNENVTTYIGRAEVEKIRVAG